MHKKEAGKETKSIEINNENLNDNEICEEPMPPIRIIHNELKALIDPKYKNIKLQIEQLLDEDKKAITINAKQVQEFI